MALDEAMLREAALSLNQAQRILIRLACETRRGCSRIIDRAWSSYGADEPSGADGYRDGVPASLRHLEGSNRVFQNRGESLI